ncbi:MAG: polysulfide reductase NrfD [Thermaerobacter sp.]|nr:polysulfide reductase NrfD [Thermaerobacter sp.]
MAEPRRDRAQAVKVYDAPHERRPWGWMVSAYLWTKSVSSGAAMLAGFSALLAAPVPQRLTGIVNPLLALLFLGATLLLLIGDLKRPERFWRLLLKPHLTSWLVWGGYILTAFGLLTTVWLALGIFGTVPKGPVLPVLLILLGAAAAAYSAFLFGQAEGRDFWQNPLVFWHLLVQAGIAAAALGAIEAFLLHLTGALWPMTDAFLGLLALHGLFTAAEMVLPHSTREVELAAHAVTHGPLRRTFWGVAVLPGLLLPFVLGAVALFAQGSALVPMAAILALMGLGAYEHVWVQAGQIVPLT